MERYRPIPYLRHKEVEVWNLYEFEIVNAKSVEERQRAEGMRRFECSEYSDQVRSLESHQWMRRAEKVHLSVYDIPLIEHEELWETGPHGTGYLSDRVLRSLQKQVEDAEYERDRRGREGREIWIKYVTGGAALLAAAASIANLILTAHRK